MDNDKPTAGVAVASLDRADTSLRVTLRGRLDSSTLPAAWTQVSEDLAQKPCKRLVVDLSEVSYCDGAGLALFAQFRKEMASGGGEVTFEGGGPELRRLLEMSTLADPLAGGVQPIRPAGLITRMGETTAAFARDIGDMIAFTGEMAAALAWACVHPWRVRGRDLLVVAEKAGANAVPVITLLGALVGAILAFQMAVPLQRYGAITLIPSILGIAIVRELGPLITAIILAGRSGSAFAAEIGTMKVTEEISALKTFGLDPVRFLVIPRVLATVLMAPLLTVLNMLAGVLCGYFIMKQYGYSFSYYINAVTNSVNYVDLLGGLCKAPVFGLIIAAIGCVRGLQTLRGPSAVGDSTTRAVVAGIVLIIVADMIFGVVYFYMGI
ncbi:MAG: MlaE family lipid ABC transporter permease subunit [Phycisphaerae bacterium]|jgi:phospholipid/cholesterol/gamma-HCH transport system permease protein